jgi:hypothetical protein
MTHRKMQGQINLAQLLLLAIVAVIAVLFFRSMSKADDAKNIQSVLRQNQQLGDVLASRIGERTDNAAEADMDRIAGYYDDYVAQMRKIDTHEVPRDFAEAFYRYTAAFEDQAQVLHNHPHVPTDEQILAARIQEGLEGDPGKQARELKAAFEAWGKRRSEKADAASRAEQDMKAVAIKYGAL